MLLLFILPLVVEAAVLLKEVMILGLVIMTSQNNRSLGRIRVKSRRVDDDVLRGLHQVDAFPKVQLSSL